jgi:hypothetical protein
MTTTQEPAFFLDAPAWVMAVEGFVIIATIAALVLAHSLTWDITFGAGLLTAIPVALFPVWLIVLSYRLPGHVLAAPAEVEDDPQAAYTRVA